MAFFEQNSKTIRIDSHIPHVSVAFGFRSGKVTIIKISLHPSGLFLNLRVRLTPLPYSVIHNTLDGFRKGKVLKAAEKFLSQGKINAAIKSIVKSSITILTISQLSICWEIF